MGGTVTIADAAGGRNDRCGRCPTGYDARTSVRRPFTPSRTYLCRYAADGSRSDARQVGSAAAVQFVAALNASRPASDTEVCGRESLTPFVLRLIGGDRALSVLAAPTGCGRVTNGVRTVSAGRDLLAQMLAGRADEGPEPALLSCAGLSATVHNDGAGLDQRLIGFTGQRIVVCPQGVSATVGELAGEDARMLADALDSAPVRKAGTAGCPSAQRLMVVVTGLVERVDIATDAGSCGWATNGSRVVELDRDTRNALRALAQLPPL